MFSPYRGLWCRPICPHQCCAWQNGSCAHMQSHAKYQWWAFGPQLHNCTGEKVKFWPFFYTFQPFLRTSWLKRKKWIEQKSCILSSRTWENLFILWLLFLSFIIWLPGVKSWISTIFGHGFAILEDFLTENKKTGKSKELHLSIRDNGDFFYFMTFITKFGYHG